MAISIADSARAVRRCVALDQPITRREKRSITTAKYNQPSQVRTYVMSAAQTSSGAFGLNLRSTRFETTGRWCFESVVLRNQRGI